MTTSRTATIRTPDVGQTVAVVGDIYRFLATGEDTDGKYHRQRQGFARHQVFE